jgi:hypothetical protein
MAARNEAMEGQAIIGCAERLDYFPAGTGDCGSLVSTGYTSAMRVAWMAASNAASLQCCNARSRLPASSARDSWGKKVRVRTCRHYSLGLQASGLACRLRSLDGSALTTVTLYGIYCSK